MKKRSMLFTVLAMIFIPFYALYWYCSFQNQLKKTTGEGFGGFGHLLATMFTFGIYGLVWSYKVGGRIEKLGGKNNGIIYLVLTLFGLSIISYFLMQNDVNQVNG